MTGTRIWGFAHQPGTSLLGAGGRMGPVSLLEPWVPICKISNTMSEPGSGSPGRINQWPKFPYRWLWSAPRFIPNFLNAHSQSPSTMDSRSWEISVAFTHYESSNLESAADCDATNQREFIRVDCKEVCNPLEDVWHEAAVNSDHPRLLGPFTNLKGGARPLPRSTSARGKVL